MVRKKWLQVKIFNVKVDLVSLEQAVKWVEDRVKYNKKGQITTPNPEQVVLSQKDEEFRKVLNKADLSICDGVGLVWATKLNSKFQIPNSKFQKLSGADLMITLCQKAAQKGWRVFLLGGREGVVDETIKNLKFKIQNCNLKFQIAGIDGAEDIKKETKEEREKIIKKINQFRPHLLFVAYGAPYQEKWVAKALPKLKVNVAMGVGGAFDFLAGKVRRAPKFVCLIGLEWLWRLFFQPWRIKRQVKLIEFIWLVIREGFKKKRTL